MDAFDIETVKSRLRAVERCLLAIASQLDYEGESKLRDLTFADIEERFVTQSRHVIELRFAIRNLNETIEVIK